MAKRNVRSEVSPSLALEARPSSPPPSFLLSLPLLLSLDYRESERERAFTESHLVCVDSDGSLLPQSQDVSRAALHCAAPRHTKNIAIQAYQAYQVKLLIEIEEF